MKLFDQKYVDSLLQMRKNHRIIYLCTITLCLALVVLFVLFTDNVGRVVSQVVSTLLTAFCGCFSLYFWQMDAIKGKILQLCCDAASDKVKTIEGKLIKISDSAVTINRLTFLYLEILTNEGERRLYVLKGRPLPQNLESKSISCQIIDNIIVEYNEQL